MRSRTIGLDEQTLDPRNSLAALQSSPLIVLGDVGFHVLAGNAVAKGASIPRHLCPNQSPAPPPPPPSRRGDLARGRTASAA